jgi:hypothetical protein
MIPCLRGLGIDEDLPVSKDSLLSRKGGNGTHMTFDGIVGIAMMALMAAAIWRLSRRRRHLGPGAIGTMHEILSQDRRNAIEMIVEERAEERRPENADGNLPELETPVEANKIR